jgi:hypothetical protein
MSAKAKKQREDSKPATAPVPGGAAQPAPASPDANRITELRVTGHLMTLDSGLFCVFETPGAANGPDPSGLPGVRISLPPRPKDRPETVSISTFRPDGWLSGGAALVRVAEGPAQVLVTVYQSPQQGPESAPRLQVLKLSGDSGAPARAAAGAGEQGATARKDGGRPATAKEPEVVAHVQRTGDVGAKVGDWVGKRGSGLWIEGFGVAPRNGVPAEDIEYQAVLGRDWLSPWVEGGKFCGSRGMALPLLGIKVRLKGVTAKGYDCRYSATFTDGSSIGPVNAGEPCETESLAALEAFQIELHPRVTVSAKEKKAPAKGRTMARAR